MSGSESAKQVTGATTAAVKSYTIAAIKTIPASCQCGGNVAFVLDFGAISYMIGCACHTWLDLSTMTFVKRFDQPESAGNELKLRHFYSEQTGVNTTTANQKQTQTKDLLTRQKCGSTVICGFVNRNDYRDKSFVQTKNGEWRRRYTIDIVTPPKFAKLQCDDCDSELTVKEGGMDRHQLHTTFVQPSAKKYMSQRGCMLAYIGAPQKAPVVTCELYTKWYTLWLVMPDGSVIDLFDAKGLTPKERFRGGEQVVFNEMMAMTPGTFMADHCWNPLTIQEYAAKEGWILDEVSFNLIVGRWACDYEERY